jgi:chromatin remodeling complex protein RSC6
LSHIGRSGAMPPPQTGFPWNPSRRPSFAQGAQEAIMATKSTATQAGQTSGGSKSPGGAGLRKPVQPSPELAEIIGAEPMPRTEVIAKAWDYIRAHNLQNPQNKREIIADDKLRAVFGKDKATMFEMSKLLSAHLK